MSNQEPPPPPPGQVPPPPPAGPPPGQSPTFQPPNYGAPQPQQPGYGVPVPEYGAGQPPPTGYGGYAAPGAQQPGYGYGGAPAAPGPNYASFWARLGATLIDAIVLSIAATPLYIWLNSVWETEVRLCTIDDQLELCNVPTDDTVQVIVIASIIALLMYVLYEVFFVGRTGQTLGRKAVGIKVVGLTTGQPVGIGKAIGRVAVSFVSRAFCFLGYLWTLWDERKQTWHDKAVDSVVVRSDA